MKFFEKIIEFVFMMQIFFCPIGIFTFIAFVLYYAINLPFNYIVGLEIIASIIGVLFVKYAIKECGSCANFINRIFKT